MPAGPASGFGATLTIGHAVFHAVFFGDIAGLEVTLAALMTGAATIEVTDSPLPDVRILVEQGPFAPDNARLAPVPVASGAVAHGGFVGEPPAVPIDPPPKRPIFIDPV